MVCIKSRIGRTIEFPFLCRAHQMPNGIPINRMINVDTTTSTNVSIISVQNPIQYIKPRPNMQNTDKSSMFLAFAFVMFIFLKLLFFIKKARRAVSMIIITGGTCSNVSCKKSTVFSIIIVICRNTGAPALDNQSTNCSTYFPIFNFSIISFLRLRFQ